VIEAECPCGFTGDFRVVAGDHREVEGVCPACGQSSYFELID
jgi:hypothetical protein